MQVRRFTVAKVFIPVRDLERRKRFIAEVRHLFGKRARLASSAEGVTVTGDLTMQEHERLARMAAEVSDWARSWRP